MFRRLLTIAIIGTSYFAVSSAAVANPGDYDTVFEFTGQGGTINDFVVQWFSADPNDFNQDFGDPTSFTLNTGPNPIILELEITGLSHTSPMDLNIFLLDPFGTGIEIIDDRGDGVALSNATLFFRDPNEGKPLPNDPDPLIDGAVYAPELPGNNNTKNPGFSAYTTTGDEEWRLVIIDDSSGDMGRFESFTIRGLVVPEPASLSLLAIGACALLRRRKA